MFVLILLLGAGLVIAFAVCMICNQNDAKATAKKLFEDNNCTPTYNYYTFNLDEKNRRWTADGVNYLFSVDDIISFELVEEKINSKQLSSMYVLITTKVQGCASLRIVNLYGKTDFSSATYRLARQAAETFIAKLTQITNNNTSQPAQTATSTSSAADEIAKYKSLLDAGAITQEEYDAKKKELLNL